jgi:hypothetical protein
LRIVDCGMRIEKETVKSEIRNSKSEMGMPMLSARNAITSGPETSLCPGKRNPKVAVDNAHNFLDRL